MKKRLVKTVQVQALSSCTLRSITDDGMYYDTAFAAGDSLVLNSGPTLVEMKMSRDNCQRCGHWFTRHGQYILTPELDEVWLREPCSEEGDCKCLDFIPFTPWFELTIESILRDRI